MESPQIPDDEFILAVRVIVFHEVPEVSRAMSIIFVAFIDLFGPLATSDFRNTHLV